MQKRMPVIIMLVLIVGLLFTWKAAFSVLSKEEREYQTYLKKAKELEEKEIYIDAVKQYQNALAVRPKDYDVALKIIEMYEKLDMENQYVNACKKAITINEKGEKPYHGLIKWYQDNGWTKNEYEIILRAIEKAGLNEYKDRLIEIKGQTIEGGIKYDELSASHKFGSTDYMLAELEGKKYLLSGYEVVFSGEYDEIGFLADGVIPVKKDGTWFFVTSAGYKKKVPPEPVEWLGAFGNGLAPACKGGVYGYYNKSMEPRHFEFEFAGPFENGLAVVEKDGKWGVINSSFEYSAGRKFDSILLDEFGYGVTYGVFFGKTNGKWQLYSKAGKSLSSELEDAKVFVSNQPAAVKVNGKWKYIDKTGKYLESPEYEDAGSFCEGFAPVMVDGKWGVIDLEFNLIVEPQYDTLTSFDSTATAIATRDGARFLLRMVAHSYGG